MTAVGVSESTKDRRRRTKSVLISTEKGWYENVGKRI